MKGLAVSINCDRYSIDCPSIIEEMKKWCECLRLSIFLSVSPNQSLGWGVIIGGIDILWSVNISSVIDVKSIEYRSESIETVITFTCDTNAQPRRAIKIQLNFSSWCYLAKSSLRRLLGAPFILKPDHHMYYPSAGGDRGWLIHSCLISSRGEAFADQSICGGLNWGASHGWN